MNNEQKTEDLGRSINETARMLANTALLAVSALGGFIRDTAESARSSVNKDSDKKADTDTEQHGSSQS